MVMFVRTGPLLSVTKDGSAVYSHLWAPTRPISLHTCAPRNTSMIFVAICAADRSVLHAAPAVDFDR